MLFGYRVSGTYLKLRVNLRFESVSERSLRPIHLPDTCPILVKRHLLFLLMFLSCGLLVVMKSGVPVFDVQYSAIAVRKRVPIPMP
jgi:hypothetical protein